ncbi:ASCH domain-containing protein [Moritella marina ATCC 15381]|uniref:N(4)-acetylcytidine amidohydrolase n=2 Tax=Moritella marina TaxID=90736 RepID=AC4CH_MORMI|nr:N(4)-acetylcytidine aminohydrolase [Moritella marina]Q9RA13.1 RecName: Full=N(4)-acetylcytidine amidohydrolase; Short=ac4C amidohydrolase [Moritella marina]QFI37671.1 ASCH domain-containing protein [Moritella marina ATCC 15381]BAA89390.1 unnamed protein product [Moritella marina ATCC 15381]
MYSCITFFQRLERSILSGNKTATIRDKSDSHYLVGQMLDACTHEDNRKMCQIEILSIEYVTFSELNRAHANAEGLPFLFMLKWIVRKIYPTSNDLFFISFRVVTIDIL